MKARFAHRVPLSTGALAVLAQARPLGDGTGLVFRTIHGRRFYNNALSNLMSDLEISAVPHGFRSSFREWCGDTRVDSDVAEFCLAHRPQSTARRAPPSRATNVAISTFHAWMSWKPGPGISGFQQRPPTSDPGVVAHCVFPAP